MRQIIGTIAIVSALLALYAESCADFCGISTGFPLVRCISILVIVVYILYHGEMNRREFEAKQKKIKAMKEAQKRAEWLAEYEQFRREKHGA